MTFKLPVYFTRHETQGDSSNCTTLHLNYGRGTEVRYLNVTQMFILSYYRY